jgi:acetyl esterase/lipase
MTSETGFHPDLRRARFLPRTVVSPRTLRVIRALGDRGGRAHPAGGTIERMDANVTVRVFRPAGASGPLPGLLFVHGGGSATVSAGGPIWVNSAPRRFRPWRRRPGTTISPDSRPPGSGSAPMICSTTRISPTPTAYADRLRRAGVPCTLHEVRGAYHGFDLIEHAAPVSRDYRGAQLSALAAALGGAARAE